MSAELALRGLVLGRGEVAVLAGVDLTVAPGEVVALVGPSGCGKSTLLDVAAGLVPPDAGEVRLDGGPAPDRPGRLALMPQGDSLLPWRTLADNVAVGARLAGVPDAAARAREAVTRYGLAGFEDHYPHALSGGMRQRAALARTALAGRPVWLLDEPFGALDALTRAELHAEVADVWARLRPTVLLVTHDPDEAAVLADRVLVSGPRPMGRLVEVAVPEARPRTPAARAAVREHVMDALRAQHAVGRTA
ncbi:MAG: ABC transporter ATP-binding protein [Thermoleophilia bacterium]|nr:ABC transporter ATP-binding protein [Thermoleophilia bacterium]